MYPQIKRTRAALLFVAVLSFNLHAAKESPLPAESSINTLCSQNATLSGYGGPVLSFTQMKGDAAILMGVRGALIIDHRFTLGAAGYGLSNFIRVDAPQDSLKQYLHLSYGGVELGYIFQPEKVVNFSGNLLLGAGIAGWHHGSYYSENSDYSANEVDPFYVVEPALYANLNVTRFMRVSAGVKYRFVDGMDSDWISNSDLKGFTGALSFSFGKF